MRLALARGSSLAEVTASTSVREAAEWAAWERLHGPLGPERIDWLAAQITAAVFNAQGGRARIDECVLFGPRPAAEPQTPEEMRRLLRLAGGSKKATGRPKKRKRT